MSEARKKITVSFTVEDFEYKELELYARAKGYGGRHVVSALAHHAVFLHMKKVPLKSGERERYERSDGVGGTGAKAVQLSASEGKNP